MRISTNVQSMVAQRYVQKHTEDKSIEDSRLSSGDRIIRAAIDPAGLAISETMRSRIRSNYQAERNTNDSISLIQVAEGSLGVMQTMGARLRELAVQSSSDTITDVDRLVVDKEFQALKLEIERLTKSTSFNGNNIIKDKSSVYDFQIGIGGKESLDRIRYDMSKIMDSSNNFGISNISLLSKESSQASLMKIDSMMGQISSSRAQLGSLSNRLDSVIQGLQVGRENLSASNSKIRDIEVASETANRAKTEIAEKASLAMLKMSNDAPGAILKIIG